MKKFLAWFLAILLVLITPVLIFFSNFKLAAFSPESTKKMFLEVDFYNQAKSVAKTSILEAGDDSAEMQLMAKITHKTLDQYDFRPKVEKIIDDFYAGLKNSNADFKIIIGLSDIKQLMMQNALAESKSLPADFSESLIPDQWQVDLLKSDQAWLIKITAFFYNNFTLILISYGVLLLLFLFFCILSGVRYLKLFFSTFLISGFLIFSQRAVWWFINPQTIFLSITDQGNTGLQLIMRNLIVYFREKTIRLLIWESALMIGISLVGIIIFSFLGQNKVGKIPFDDHKNS